MKEDSLVLNITINGSNIMGNPLLKAQGVAVTKGRTRQITKDTPITSVKDFVEAFNGLFQEA